MGNYRSTPLDLNGITKSTVQVANTTVFATKAAVNRTVDALSASRVGEALIETGSGIARTGSSAIYGAGYAAIGTAVTAAGAIQGNDKVYKQGMESLNEAKHKLIDAMVGRAKASASVTVDISRPYQVKFSPVSVDAKVLEGAIGMALIQPILMMVKPSVKQHVRRETEKLFDFVVKSVRNLVKEIKFNGDSVINVVMQNAWHPDNLKARFKPNGQLSVSLDSKVVFALGDKIETPIKQSLTDSVRIEGQQYNTSIEIDTANGIFDITIYGIDDMVETIKCQILKGVIMTIGDSCYDCHVTIDPSDYKIKFGLDIFVKVPL